MRHARGRTSRAAWGPPGEAPAVLRSLQLSEGRWQTETAAGRGPPGGPRPSTAVLLSNVLSGAQALVP